MLNVWYEVSNKRKYNTTMAAVTIIICGLKFEEVLMKCLILFQSSWNCLYPLILPSGMRRDKMQDKTMAGVIKIRKRSISRIANWVLNGQTITFFTTNPYGSNSLQAAYRDTQLREKDRWRDSSYVKLVVQPQTQWRWNLIPASI